MRSLRMILWTGGLSCLLWLGGASLSPSLAAPLIIQTAAGHSVTLDVAIAATTLSRERGLMNRPHLDARTGMLFVFDSIDTPKFRMKDTLIPLDMVFIGADGIIKGIHARAIPHDETPIPSPEPVLTVLEINGGEAETLGISTGDKVIYNFSQKDLK